MIIFADTIFPRLEYVSDFIGKQLTGEEIVLTSDKKAFLNADGVKINYSANPIDPREYHIEPNGLLFQSKIIKQEIDFFEVGGLKAFFRTGGDLGFDLFAAIFFLISRYEEYLPHEKDIYGRYAHVNSVAFREGFLQIPLVDQWLKAFGNTLASKFPTFKPVVKRFQFIPTYDIDEAYSYRHKSLWRQMGGAGKALLKRNWQGFVERLRVLGGGYPDPFYSFNEIDKINEKYNLDPRYFFLVAGSTGRFDRNILPGKKAMKELIGITSSKYDIGIHPSWRSGDQHELLEKEIKILERLSAKKVEVSRQHFIRMNLPETYRRLINAGIREDFSMGYGSINGFRASVSVPYHWYDLEKEETTSLLLYPFCFMEANSFFEQKQNPGEALKELLHYYEEVKAVKGVLVTLWHNTFLGTAKLFTGWREVYINFLEKYRSGS